MFQRFLRFVLSLVLKGLKTNQMTNSIDKAIKERVLSEICTNTKLTVLDNGKLNSIKYEAIIRGESLTFDIEYSNKTIHVYFEGTSIKHMSTLKEYFEKILLGIQIEKANLCAYFEIRIQSA